MRHSLLLGAGASISSGVPTADHCLWQWKRTLFLSRHPQIEHQLTDPTLPSVQQRIQRWLDMEGIHPAKGAPEEYGHFVEACYPIAADRAQYFRTLTARVAPHVGYRLLALLAEARLLKSIWTTNFDGLAAKGISTGGALAIEVGLDSAGRIDRAQASNEVMCVALHGDYRYDSLKNTATETRTQDQQLREALERELRDTTLIVAGYSGRDDSVMTSLDAAYGSGGPGRLFWCGHDGAPTARVDALLRHARGSGREAHFIPGSDFDDLFWRLAIECLEGTPRATARQLYSAALASAGTDRLPFDLATPVVQGFLKSNAFPVDCPSEVLECTVAGLSGLGTWRRLREMTASNDVVAVPYKGKVLALGTIDAIRSAFAPHLRGDVVRTPVAAHELVPDNSVIVELFTRAILRTLADTHALSCDDRNLLWTSAGTQRVGIDRNTYVIHDAILCHLRSYSGRQYFVLKPTLKVTSAKGDDPPREVEKEFKRSILTKQYNRQFNEALERWRKLLIPANATSLAFPRNHASSFRFTIGRFPAFASLYEGPSGKAVILPPIVQSNARYRGRLLVEPRLCFSARDGSQIVNDAHPIRGLVRNRPFDFALTRSGLHAEVSVGAICPSADSARLAGFLARLHQQVSPTSKSEYLLDYPGFAQAFGLPLNIPDRRTPGWLDCPEPPASSTVPNGAAEIARHITRAIDTLQATGEARVAVVYVPERWRVWERYDLPEGRFDLHDFTKAYAVQRGMATQFIRESTLAKPHACEVMWWLALALYAKSMRTPWRLEEPDSSVAFMGLGFSVDRSRERGQHVVVGCSHIYSAEGLGLRFRLKRLEDPIVRQGNPFMKRDDARRVAEGARQLFFESNMVLPRRVAIHKRTPFSDEEVVGLREGLAGIEEIDLLEITVDPSLRWIASTLSWGKPQADAFPVKRGTVICVEDQRALLWVHGTAAGLDPARRYYQGKSRIPAPLVVTRHGGRTPLAIIAGEILGLTKMNWNTLDLYSTMPATVESSNAIATIGALLQRFGPQSYDYRLFM